ncbi:uncharacterized protein BT62DRAFT_935101 [Guyanagaster necrorhizus]|uniref:Uncharacterized protein n=1 Tax=Guyanagaster necrorhizus TaxID=856835 RepID=A0A9P7VLP4_9AGAR|nr:uncharacterized protein BT62DRAFT_935101 [Guyanagaster necrorhizus MCA 3950]KAG7443476.1 hypothetical protein BT62DRAFT_935101 [Guyanagaster necrorhizus MCA 3950]
MAALTQAFRDSCLGRIRELTLQLFNGAAVEFPAPVIIALLAHCSHLKHVHFRGYGAFYGNYSSFGSSEMWKQWLFHSRGRPYAVVSERRIKTISFEGIGCQRMEDVLAFMVSGDSPFDIEGLQCLSIPCVMDYDKPSSELCAILERILARAREHIEELRLCFSLSNDLIPLPCLRTLGLYVRRKAEHGTELLRWTAENLANETMAPSIEVGFAFPKLRWTWQDELRQHRAEDMGIVALADLSKDRHSVDNEKYRELLVLLSSFDSMDGVMASRVAQGVVNELKIVGPRRDESGLNWDEKLRGALFPRSEDRLKTCRATSGLYC